MKQRCICTLPLTFAIIFSGLLLVTAQSQEGVPMEILTRTVMVKFGDRVGTAFAIQQAGELYFITAKHVVGTDDKPMYIWSEGDWRLSPVLRVIYAPDAGIDVAAIDTGQKAAAPFSVQVGNGSSGPLLGQQVWFLGYPFGELALTTHAFGRTLPFIKRATFSGGDVKSKVLYFDGLNNHGFSGGPVVFYDFKNSVYRIFAVVVGYESEKATALIDGHEVPTPLIVNSGIMAAYDIKPIVDAISSVAAVSRH